MLRTAALVCCSATILSAFFVSAAAQGFSSPQLQFTAENERVDRPVPLSTPVFLALKASVLADRPEDPPPSEKNFSATALPPPSGKRRLYMVQGNGPLAGANTVLFWLVEEDTLHDTARVLWSGQELEVRLSYNPPSKYPVIEASLVAQQLAWTSTYGYVGGQYKLLHSNDADNQKILNARDK